MKISTRPLLFALVLFIVGGFRPMNSNTTALQKTLSLQMPAGAGTYGAAVVYNPGLKKYYAAYGGSITHPMAIFDASGNLLSDPKLKTMVDIRGLWYDAADKALKCNTYNKSGWYRYVLDATGKPEAAVMFVEGMKQPDAQSQGAFDEKGKRLLFYKSDSLYIHDAQTGLHKSTIAIKLTDARRSYLNNGIVYIGGAKQEFVLLNTDKKSLSVFSAKDGSWIRDMAFNSEEKMPTVLGFSYCNSIYWLFDVKNRVWQGYKTQDK